MLRHKGQDALVEGWQGVLPAMSVLLLCLVVVLAMHLRLPKGGVQLAVIFPPGTSLLEGAAILGAADARLVRAGALDNIIIAEFSRDLSLGEFLRHGMLVALDPLAIGGCIARHGRQPDVNSRTAAS